ncbi:MAG: hypothetical protein JNM84_18705 [Planctomycetes bacterium]|nr:hypothetical protein [Planctomycetota bacterium]
MALREVKKLLADGFHPIVFCRYIQTAESLGEALRSHLGKKAEVSVVTGTLPPEERELRVSALAASEAKARVLVCTDCLSEGINLQEHFDAVVHYDLSWNPTRHEQREGRVDRYGQRTPVVRALTLYGKDNPIDGAVLDVLLKKHQKIRKKIGISVPVPTDPSAISEALREKVLLLGGELFTQDRLTPSLFPELEEEEGELGEMHREWERSAEREKRSRTLFAQESIKPAEVQAELDAARRAIGSHVDVERFVRAALGPLAPGSIEDRKHGRVRIDLGTAPAAVRDLAGEAKRFDAAFSPPRPEDGELLVRTHPFVERLAAHVVELALEELPGSPASRAGAIRTKSVTTRTTLLLLRFRAHLTRTEGERVQPLLVEELRVAGFAGGVDAARFLSTEDAERLLDASPDENLPPDQARTLLRPILDGLPQLASALRALASSWSDEVLAAHRRVREAAKAVGKFSIQVEPTPDVLGLYLLLPIPPGGAR